MPSPSSTPMPLKEPMKLTAPSRMEKRYLTFFVRRF